eukprot:4811117-Prymnesium_polylepis.1
MELDAVWAARLGKSHACCTSARHMRVAYPHVARNPSQTNFERGVAMMAEEHVSHAVRQLKDQHRPIPEAVARAERSRAKLVDISGAEAPPLDTAHRGSGLMAHLNAVRVALESAKFTNDADRGAVAHMLFGLEWTMHTAVEEVLARRGGSAKLTEAPTERAASVRGHTTAAAALFVSRLRLRAATRVVHDGAAPDEASTRAMSRVPHRLSAALSHIYRSLSRRSVRATGRSSDDGDESPRAAMLQ